MIEAVRERRRQRETAMRLWKQRQRQEKATPAHCSVFASLSVRVFVPVFALVSLMVFAVKEWVTSAERAWSAFLCQSCDPM